MSKYITNTWKRFKTGFKAKLEVKHFNNKFEDYSERNIDLEEIHKSSSTSYQGKWNELERKFRRIDQFDPSVYTGVCGLTLLKLKKDEMSTKNNLKALAKMLPSPKIRKRKCSFLCGHAGPLAIGAVIYYRTEDEEKFQKCIDRVTDPLKTFWTENGTFVVFIGQENCCLLRRNFEKSLYGVHRFTRCYQYRSLKSDWTSICDQ